MCGSSCRESITMKYSETLGDEVAKTLLLLELVAAGLGAGNSNSSKD